MTAVFVNVRGQDDNIGDSGLRNALLAAVRTEAYTLHVNVGGQSDGYISGLGVHPSDVLYRSSANWYAALRSNIRHRAGMLWNAGERNPGGGARIFDRTEYIAVAAGLLLRAPRALSGVGLRTTQPLSRANQWALRAMDLVSWRDPVSRDTAGVGEVQPDWAFALGTESPQAAGRHRLALVLRGDRDPLTEPHLDAVRLAARDRGLRTTVVVQVKGDRDYARHLAGVLDAELVDWVGDDHHRQEGVIRAVYRESAFVLGDRLHALIYGFTEGSAPIAFSAARTEKATRTFAAVHVDAITFEGAPSPAALGAVLDGVDARRPQLDALRREARGRLAARSDELRRLFHPRR